MSVLLVVAVKVTGHRVDLGAILKASSRWRRQWGNTSQKTMGHPPTTNPLTYIHHSFCQFMACFCPEELFRLHKHKPTLIEFMWNP